MFRRTSRKLKARVFEGRAGAFSRKPPMRGKREHGEALMQEQQRQNKSVLHSTRHDFNVHYSWKGQKAEGVQRNEVGSFYLPHFNVIKVVTHHHAECNPQTTVLTPSLSNHSLTLPSPCPSPITLISTSLTISSHWTLTATLRMPISTFETTQHPRHSTIHSHAINPRFGLRVLKHRSLPGRPPISPRK
jgi:hypothetical protein